MDALGSCRLYKFFNNVTIDNCFGDGRGGGGGGMLEGRESPGK